MSTFLFVLLFTALGVLGYAVHRLYTMVRRLREESSQSFEVALRLQDDWERFTAKEREERRRFIEKMERAEMDVQDRVERFEKVAVGTRERLVKLEKYLKEFFEVELKSVFESFDKTVSSVLEEMKSELLRGVDRIEEIQAVVDSKTYAKDRILEGEGSVYKLISDTAPAEEGFSSRDRQDDGPDNGVGAPEKETPVEAAKEPTKPRVVMDSSRLRLRADEAE